MKDIPGYEGKYGITSCGKVWSYKTKSFIYIGYNKKDYEQVQLWKNNKRKTFLIHRLVAEAFIPNPNNLLEVDHIDGNKEHNYINNLQWITHENNVRKSMAKKVLCIETNIIYESTQEAYRQTKISQGNIASVCRGERKIAGGYHWRYVE